MSEKILPTRKFECPNCKTSDYRMSTLEIGTAGVDTCPKCGAQMKIVGDTSPDWLRKIQEIVGRELYVDDFVAFDNKAEFEVAPSSGSLQKVMKNLRKIGYISAARGTPFSSKLIIMKSPVYPREKLWPHLLLFCITFLSVLAAGYFILFESLTFAMMFAISLMLMLSSHELGHMISAWKNGIDATPPYFIPFPSALGTMGAIVSIRSPPPTKDALVEMGAAGPLSGFLIAIPLALLGLFLSIPSPSGLQLPASPLIFLLFQLALFGQAATPLLIHPLAFAGWVVFFLTFFNLLPAGQLDGGHVARGLLRMETHHQLTIGIGLLMLFSGVLFASYPFWFWGFLILLAFRDYHSGPLDEVSALSKRGRLMAVASWIVFILCLPIPVGGEF
ncbi:MAG: site-2 protease family protein [Candidatus Hadarchaeales archaeon]